MSYDIVNERTMGVYPLSIATSLAFEGLTGNHPEYPTAINRAADFPTYLINIRTLIRNIFQSVDSVYQMKVTHDHVVQPLVSEMESIIDVVKQISPLSEVQFYFCHYQGIPRLFPEAHLRKISSPKQIHYAGLENSTINELLPLLKDKIPVLEYNVQIADSFGTTAMITHLPVDLLWRYQFTELHLLESHTGKLKRNVEWNSKLTNGKTLDRIPFCRFSLQLFGDSGNFFAPFNVKVRQVILDLAKKDNWNTATTNDKIRYTLSKIHDPVSRARLLDLV